MPKLVKLSAVGAFAMLGFAAPLPAAATPSVGVDYTATGSFVCNQDCVKGYEFTVTNSTGITVTALGAFDGAQGNPSNGGAVADLTNSEIVDLFTTGGTLLATATVGDGVGSQVGTWWDFLNLGTAAVLTPGTYIVASTINNNDAAGFPISSTIVGAGITYDKSEFCDDTAANNAAGSNGTSYCGLNTADFVSQSGTNNAYLGGNIEYTLGGDAPAPVPEPMTISLFGAGIAGAVAMRRRKKTKQA